MGVNALRVHGKAHELVFNTAHCASILPQDLALAERLLQADTLRKEGEALADEDQPLKAIKCFLKALGG